MGREREPSGQRASACAELCRWRQQGLMHVAPDCRVLGSGSRCIMEWAGGLRNEARPWRGQNQVGLWKPGKSLYFIFRVAGSCRECFKLGSSVIRFADSEPHCGGPARSGDRGLGVRG